jgi:hypothetical protein
LANSGKYDFKGIKKLGAGGLKLALSSSPYTAWLAKAPGVDLLLEPIVNWMANNGLIILNIGAIVINGKIDQKILDDAIEDGIKKVEQSGASLTPDQIKEIDDAVIQAARKALPYARH